MASGTSHHAPPVKDQYHHFIPRFILRRFQDPVSVRKTRKERNEEFRKTGQSQESVLIYDVAACTLDKRLISNVYGMTNLYKDIRAADVNEVEKKLSVLEAKAATVINKLHDSLSSGVFRLDRQQLNDLRKFLFVQHYRNQNLSGSYFDENHPENSPLRDWILHRQHKLSLESSADLWLHTLRYYLDTPHGEILVDAQKEYDKHGRINIQALLGGRLDPSVENYNAVAYELQANLHCLGIWEAADEEFVITNSSFGLWEGWLLPGQPHVHRLFVISPRIILVLRHGFLRSDTTGHLRMPLSPDSSLLDIELPTPTPKYGPESSKVFSVMPSDDGMEWNRHRATPAALKDIFTFKIIKLTQEQTFNVNQIILDNVHKTGSVTFSSREGMQHTGRKYCTQIGSFQKHLVAPILPLLESKYSPSAVVGAKAPTEAAVARCRELDQIIADIVMLLPTRVWGSDYDRAYTLHTIATAEEIAPNDFAQKLEATVETSIIMLTKKWKPPRPSFTPKNKKIVSTLSKQRSTQLMAVMAKALNVSQPTDLSSTLVHQAAIVGVLVWVACNRHDQIKVLIGNIPIFDGKN